MSQCWKYGMRLQKGVKWAPKKVKEHKLSRNPTKVWITKQENTKVKEYDLLNAPQD